MLTLFAGKITDEALGPVGFGESESVLYVLSGISRVSIAGHDFEAGPGSGVHVRHGETLEIRTTSSEPFRFLMVVCPSPDRAPWEAPAGESAPFDPGFPDRVVSADAGEREATGDRYYRVLVGPKTGSGQITQFIGSIPLSRAPEHFHLYEEVICVLSGEGYMWIGDHKAAVRPGSLIFLPRKQPHCLECTSDGGLELVGMFYPAGSPAVNYKTGEQ